MKIEKRLGLHKLVESRGRFLVHWINAHGADGKSAKRDPLACLVEGFLRVEAGGKWADYLKSLESCGIPTAPIVMLRPSQLDCDFTINADLQGGKPYFEIRPIGERGVLLSYFHFLSQVGQVNRVRLCPNCRRWFFARRTDSKLCSARCQDSAWRKTDAGKKARREYMRKHRKDQRERERKQYLTGGGRKAARSILRKLGKGD